MSREDRSNAALLAQQAARESNARTYPRHLPLAIERARGVEVEDVDGDVYYDFTPAQVDDVAAIFHEAVAATATREVVA